LILLSLMPLLMSCATNGVATDSGCGWVKPIYISKKDVLTDGTARAILKHNETWQKICQH